MKLTELAAAFRAEYNLLAASRNLEVSDIPDALLALWISEGLGAVVRALHGITSVVEAELREGEKVVALPADFGTLLSFSIDGTPFYDAVVENSEQPLLRLGQSLVAPGKVVIRYTPSIEVFSPSSDRRQNWGALVNGSLEGNLILPDRYVPLMKKFLIAKVLPDQEVAFEKELIRQRESASSGFSHAFKYHFGV